MKTSKKCSCLTKNIYVQRYDGSIYYFDKLIANARSFFLCSEKNIKIYPIHLSESAMKSSESDCTRLRQHVA